jgi:hypothetical protein
MTDVLHVSFGATRHEYLGVLSLAHFCLFLPLFPPPGIVGVRFKRLIMDDTGHMPKSRAPRPPKEESFK